MEKWVQLVPYIDNVSSGVSNEQGMSASEPITFGLDHVYVLKKSTKYLQIIDVASSKLD